MTEETRRLWDSNLGYDAGMIITKAIPNTSQPRWAARVLRLVLVKSEVSHPLINEALNVADCESKWGNGHAVFSKVRDVVLLLDEKEKVGLTKDEELLADVLAITELVAKVAYNATSPPDEFDEDSGAWIVALLRKLVEAWSSDSRFAEDAWQAVMDHH